jgi:hypothetical protein
MKKMELGKRVSWMKAKWEGAGDDFDPKFAIVCFWNGVVCRDAISQKSNLRIDTIKIL